MSPAKKKAVGRSRSTGGGAAAGGRRRKKGADLEIHLVTSVGADPSDPTLKKNKGVSEPDRVRWINDTDRGHALTFTNWPFVEPPESIAIAAGKKSKWYTLYPETPNGMYDYSIDPTINPPSGPPGEPGILVGD